MNILYRAIAMAAIGGLLHAQTYIVDANNGPGTNFTNLAAAIAAVPDGATLRVRDGLYSSQFSILGKGLKIIAERPGGATLGFNTGQVVIGQLAATQRVVISGLSLFVTPSQPFRFFNAAGPIELSAWNMTTGSFSVSIESCANVHITDCTLLGKSMPNPAPPALTIVDSAVEIATTKIQAGSAVSPGVGPGGMGILIKGGSRVTLASSTVRGGSGSVFFPATSGGPGIVVTEGSLLHAYGSYPSGGNEEVAKIEGGSGIGLGGADGGPGIVVQGLSQARVIQVSLVGGASNGATPGLPSTVETGSTLEYLPNALTPRLRTLGTIVPSQPLTLRLLAEPYAAAVLLLGQASAFDRPASIGLGAITVDAELVLAPLVVPATGVLDFPATVPAAWAFGQLAYGQYLTCSALRSEVQGSNMAAFVVR